MTDLSTGRRQVVALSRRLAPATPEDHRIDDHAELEVVALHTEADIVANARLADVIIVGAVEPFAGDILTDLPNLRALVRRGVGLDNVNVELATRLGIAVANVPDASVNEVAEHALALLLTLERRIVGLHDAVTTGRWNDDPAAFQRLRVQCRRMSELTLGVIGLGRIGRELARRAVPLYRRVVAVDPFFVDGGELRVKVVGLEEALRAADHLSLHVPMAADRRHLIGVAELALLPAGAVMVNTARGGLVDEQALVAALRSGQLAGAGIDVTEQEPLLPDHVYRQQVPNLLLTGHSAAWSSAATEALVRRSVDAAIELVEGRLPSTLINPDVAERPELRLAPAAGRRSPQTTRQTESKDRT